MERRRRALFAALIAAIIVVAVFSSFALNFFTGERVEVHLADPSAQPGQGDTEGPGSGDGSFVRVDVTPETVQSVIAALSRPASYYRQITIELWAGQSGEYHSVTTAQVWVDNGWIRSDITGPGGMVQHNLVGDGTHWRWYDDEEEYISFPAEEATADLVQRIPTYEDVLALDQEEITGAGYEDYGGLACVYVEVEQEELGSRERYWVASSSGLLVAAERVKGEQVVYRMTALTMESPAPMSSSFALPDSTVLHTVGEEAG